MIEHFGPRFDPAKPLELSIVATALCQELTREIARLETGHRDFAEFNELYASIYQPKAIGLVHAFLDYVPSSDPRITVSAQAGDNRLIERSADLDVVSEPLHRDFMVTQLKGVVSIFKQLLGYLPKH
ncbi:MAG TPA: hypothetical protein VFA67_14310 [Candidatus Sulfotelmatobacter sp.]|nr:hypothetical protein [Candidatus Sulfotelmatobacter sp.]